MNMIADKSLSIAKSSGLLFVFLLLCLVGKAQDSPVYSAESMHRLKTMIDSLRAYYALCEVPVYYSLPQTWGYIITETERVAELKQDLEAKMPLAALRTKYPDAIEAHPCVVTKERRTQDNLMIYHCHRTYTPYNYDIEKDSTWAEKRFTQEAVFKAREDFLWGVYIEEDFKTYQIPPAYAKQILYVDKMVGNTPLWIRGNPLTVYEQAFFEPQANPEKIFRRALPHTARLHKIMAKISRQCQENHQYSLTNGHADKFANNNIMPTVEDMEICLKEDEEKSRRFGALLNVSPCEVAIARRPIYKKRLKKAFEELIANRYTDEDVESFLAPHLSKRQLLQLKRIKTNGGHVCGNCNHMPYRTYGVACLAAEVAQADIFLQAHLEALAFQADPITKKYTSIEQTIYTLEALGVNMGDLLFGAIYSGNFADGRYMMRVRSAGKILAEFPEKKKKELEDLMFRTIADESLDDYNRLQVYYMLVYYNEHYPNTPRKKANRERLKAFVESTASPLFRALAIKPKEGFR